jgi:hypothetical protein
VAVVVQETRTPAPVGILCSGEAIAKASSKSKAQWPSTTLSITKTKCTGPRQPFFLEYSDSQRVHIKL